MSVNVVRIGRGLVLTGAALALLAGSSGSSCDSTAQDSFRSTAAGPIGDGIKSIFSGIVDGAVAAVQSTADSSSSSANSSTSGSGT